jgi:peptide-methionine (S)-S-oxide reductase
MPLLRRFCLALAATLLTTTALAQAPAKAPAVATFAGGCFWCMEAPFDKLPGVISTTAGYMGGTKKDPTYEEVSSGTTGHTEVVQVAYDPAKVSYAALLDVYWKNIDPTVTDRQFCDRGTQYRTAIFVHTDEQKKLAEESRRKLEFTKPFKEPIVTPVVAAGAFWPAEEYHQDYYLKNPVRYNYYRTGCGRDARLKALWGEAPH